MCDCVCARLGELCGGGGGGVYVCQCNGAGGVCVSVMVVVCAWVGGWAHGYRLCDCVRGCVYVLR